MYLKKECILKYANNTQEDAKAGRSSIAQTQKDYFTALPYLCQ